MSLLPQTLLLKTMKTKNNCQFHWKVKHEKLHSKELVHITLKLLTKGPTIMWKGHNCCGSATAEQPRDRHRAS